jgi:Mce-associated membrane protein
MSTESEPETRRWVFRMAALTLAAIAVLVAAGVLGTLAVGAHGRAAAGSAARVVAERVALLLSSGNQADVPRRLDELRSNAVGEFRTQLDDAGQSWQAILQGGRVDSRGTVAAAGVQRVSGDDATVLVALRATVSSTAQEQPQERHYRIAVDLRRTSDGWRAARVETVQ